jgi:hypothetical protein
MANRAFAVRMEQRTLRFRQSTWKSALRALGYARG